ncbi:MAG: peptidylprolyl isomerase [Pseudomonadota bacterium]
MRAQILSSLAAAVLATTLHAQETEDLPAYPRVSLETTAGTIVLELDSRRAPLTVRHFLTLVEEGSYNESIFHRVIPNFIVQAGGFNRDFESLEGDDSIVNESGNGLTNLRGTVAMARLAEPHTANAQFFINVADNRSLDPRSDRWGYTVFGYVVEGMDIVDAISTERTGPGGQFSQDVPVVPIIIERAVRSEL